MMASINNNSLISSTVESLVRISPGSDAPKVIESKLARTDREITTGIELDLNQLFPKIEDEFKMKTLPIAARHEPIKQNAGYRISINILSQTPAMTNIPPNEHPHLIPNLSRI